jgi:PTH1 family peptidyl-tRNA hydrolase
MSRLGRLFEKFRPASSPPTEQAPRAEAQRWIIAGLGNPGEQYGRSRHNLGFRTIIRLAEQRGVKLNQRKFNGLSSEARVADFPVILVMPQTYYNRSGDCLSSMLGYYKTPVERLIVIHDEMDLPIRQIRIKRGGGDAGNRGVRSIASSLGSRDFIRVRIGVGHPGESAGAVEHVLESLSDAELREVEPILDRAVDSIQTILREGLERAMGIYNQRV